MNDPLHAVFREFVGETAENLAAIETELLALENAADPKGHFREIQRCLHNLKGNVSVFGLVHTARFTHALEDLVGVLQQGAEPVTSQHVGLLLEAVDRLRKAVPRTPPAEGDIEPILESIDWLAATARALLNDAGGSDHQPVARAAAASGEQISTIRIEARRLDALLDLVTELTASTAALHQRLEAADERVHDEIFEARQQTLTLQRQLQEEVMRIRMVPVGAFLLSFRRAVRDLAAQTGKEVDLVIEGEDVEADVSVVGSLRDPLTHMIRNAVDHGIERPEVRSARGKPATGTIRLAARHETGEIVFEIADDGAGLDTERILARGRERGLITESAHLRPDEIHALIFEPGFSTSPEVSAISGRGVGMDVVRRNVEGLRGRIRIDSDPGAGTRFTLRLPLTLAILDGFVVGVADERYILPMTHLLECFDLPAERMDDGLTGLINRRGASLPFVRLGAFLGNASQHERRENVVVVQVGDRRLGFVVDHLHGEVQAIVKPLNRVMEGVPGLAGTSILGDGRVALLLDLPSIVQKILHTLPASDEPDGAPLSAL